LSITTGGAEFNIASTSLQTSVTIQEWGSAMNSSKPAAEGGIDSLPEPNVTGTDPSASAPSEPENYAGLGLDDVNPGVPPPKLSLVKFWPSTPLPIQPAALRMKVPDIS
jgi:hypothetical protein